LGTSSPIETIIRSILYPAKSIKEGFELKRVVNTDGSEIMGYLVSDGLNVVTIRDITGKEVPVAKSNIKDIGRVPGSLMPGGLTANLEKQDFTNLVSYLSNIGESGRFRVPNERYVRRWSAVSTDKKLVNRIRETGIGQIVNDKEDISVQPVYSKVSGELPLEELPVFALNSGKQYSFVKFDVEVLTEGQVKFGMGSTTGVNAWAGKKQVTLTNDALVTNLPKGTHSITLAIDRSLRKKEALKVQLQHVENTSAQTRLITGQ
jgi:putative heme-binding domain-containing protein